MNQHHFALLLLMEVFTFPHRREADRIWACLDYVFELPNPAMPQTDKARWVVTEVRNKMGIYLDARQVRAPKGMVMSPGPSQPVKVGKIKAPEAELPQSSFGIQTFFVAPGATAGLNRAADIGVAKPQGPVNDAHVALMADEKMVDIDWVCLLSDLSAIDFTS